MPRSYEEMRNLAEQIYQDTGNSVAGTVEWDYWIEEGLKKFSTYRPHITEVIYKIESRYGTDATGTANKLTDTVKSQFVAGDATDEKVVHNITDHTYAVVLANDSPSVNALSADIMDANESYRIYNKRCWKNNQIYIGDVTDYLRIDSVEYPLGTKRNWELPTDEILEILVSEVSDSNLNATDVPNIDVLVRFVKSHKLNQMTDLSLAVANSAGYAAAVTSMAVDAASTTGTEVIEAGEEFHLANKRWTYTVAASATASTGGTATLTFYPGAEDAVIDNDVLTFRKSTLKPQDEEIFGRLVAARAAMSDSRSFIGAINFGGLNTQRDYIVWKRELYDEVIGELRGSKPRSKRLYTRA
ncbi:hypothetical protein LCGC14_0385340 [marine sediment metagenome]|uniref:Uncharacterized protein n=1 Tax=marine sediment metagenome TaxID=412755 RepID=A0A0F9TJF2_9ZZZZ